MARTDFNVTIINSNLELSARDRIKLKDTSTATKFDDIINEEGQQNGITVSVKGYAILAIHNEHAKDGTDYEQTVIVTADDTRFVTGSTSFRDNLCDISDELLDEGITEFDILVYKQKSKNRDGKYFITCALA